MAASNKATRIGVIAEERNDIDVLYEFAAKIITEKEFSFSRFCAHGCGKLRRKCSSWARNLIDRGCSCLVIMHDRDQNDEQKIRNLLEKEIKDVNITHKIILIPVEELEAWLLSDENALKEIFNMAKTPKIPHHPETVSNPKEFLASLVRKNSRAQYINTVHNQKIARAIKIAKLGCCPSFAAFPSFLREVFPASSFQKR